MNSEEAIRKLLQKDKRYTAGAYDFARTAVSTVTEEVRRGKGENALRHITGQELLEGMRELALSKYGGLAVDVFENWGIRTTEDIGNIVFLLADVRLLGVSETDSIEDFKDVFDFNEAFLKPFLENRKLPDAPPKID